MRRIVGLADKVDYELRKASKAFHRSLNSQAKQWITIGMLNKLNPTKDSEQIRNLLFQHENFSIEKIIALWRKK